MKKGNLYLIPTTLGESSIDDVIPPLVKEILNNLSIYIVEEIRTARRYLVKAKINKPIDSINFLIFNEHSDTINLKSFITPLLEGHDVGILSEAGVPAVADPGNLIVMHAHQNNIKVIPLTGPSSIILALMASGLNGQNFAFNGYLPVPKDERIKKIKFFEKKSALENQTQIFIEAPYRNRHLLTDLINNCSSETFLTVACDLTLQTEFIKTAKISDWKKFSETDLHKRPTIFLIHKF